MVSKNVERCSCLPIEDVDRAMITASYHNPVVFCKRHLLGLANGGLARGKCPQWLQRVEVVKTKPVIDDINYEQVLVDCNSRRTTIDNQYKKE